MLRRLEAKFQTNSECVDGGRAGKGFAMAGVSSEAYRGFQLAPYGVQLGADAVHPSAYPLEKESVGAFVKRCCVKIPGNDADEFDPVDDRTLAHNAVNSDAKSEWVNAREWGKDARARAEHAWILLDAPLDAIQAMQKDANEWKRVESTRAWTTCAVFVPR